MSVLIRINGPPGIGKSTIAQLYADRHPGVRNLDIDKIPGLIGGWQHRFAETGELVRPIAKAMARTHLEAGGDVVMPHFIGRISELTDAGVWHRQVKRIVETSGGDELLRSLHD